MNCENGIEQPIKNIPILISDEIFEKMLLNYNNSIASSLNSSQLKSVNKVQSFNYCQVCNIAMHTTISGYECSNCGMLQRLDGEIKDCDEDSMGTLRVCQYGQRNFYNISPDYSRIQKKTILIQLNTLKSQYEREVGPCPFSDTILSAVATKYNDIQQLNDLTDSTLNDNDQKNMTEDKKKFVRRGNIKDEILGCFIQEACIKSGQPVKNKTICLFMKLTSSGMSRGKDIVRNLYLSGQIEQIDIEDIGNKYTELYLSKLNIINLDLVNSKLNNLTPDQLKQQTKQRNYIKFINEIVRVSVIKKIGMHSIITSKIAGAIWVLIKHVKLNIKYQTLEIATENIRKNTWNRYSKEIENNILSFIDVFNECGISHGVLGTLIKKRDLDKFIKDNHISNYSIVKSLL